MQHALFVGFEKSQPEAAHSFHEGPRFVAQKVPIAAVAIVQPEVLSQPSTHADLQIPRKPHKAHALAVDIHIGR